MAEKGFAIRCPHCQQWNIENDIDPEEIALDTKEELETILNNCTLASKRELDINALFSRFSHKKLFRCKSPPWVCPTSFEAFVCRSKDNVPTFLDINKPSSLTRSFELYKSDCQSRWQGQYYTILFCTQPVPRLRFTELDQLMERELLRRLIVGVGDEIRGPVTFYALNFFENEIGKPQKYWMPIEGYSPEEKCVPPKYNSLCDVCRKLVLGQLKKEFKDNCYNVNKCPIQFGKKGKCASRNAACMQEQIDWNHCPAFIEERMKKCPCYNSDQEVIRKVEKEWQNSHSEKCVEHKCYLGFSEVGFPIEVHKHLVGVAVTGQVCYDSQEIVPIKDFIDGKSKFDIHRKPWELLQSHVEEMEEAKKKLLEEMPIQANNVLIHDEFYARTRDLYKNIKRIEDASRSQYRDHRGKSEAAFRAEILTFIRTYKEKENFFDERLPQVLERMWKFWAFEGAYFGRYSQTTEDFSIIAYSTAYEGEKSFGFPGKGLERVKIDSLDIHPCKYLYREDGEYSGENLFLKKIIPIFENAKKDTELHVPEGKGYYIVLVSFSGETYVFVFTVRDKEAASLLESLDPAGVSELCQDEILETCIQTAYEFRENRNMVEKRAELNFTKKMGNLVHTNGNRLFSTIGKLEIALENYKGISKKEIEDSLDNTRRTNGSLHAVDTLSKYMESKVSGKPSHLKKLNIMPTDLREVLSYLETETDLKGKANTWVGSLVIESPKTELVLKMDLWVIYELLYCIIDNAITHGPREEDKKDEDTKITVTTEISSKGRKPTLVIKVIDTGKGVDGKTSDKINRYLSSGALNEWPQQIGYGLLMVKCGVELHKGTILFSSKPNEGTTVEIQLPI